MAKLDLGNTGLMGGLAGALGAVGDMYGNQAENAEYDRRQQALLLKEQAMARYRGEIEDAQAVKRNEMQRDYTIWEHGKKQEWGDEDEQKKLNKANTAVSDAEEYVIHSDTKPFTKEMLDGMSETDRASAEAFNNMSESDRLRFAERNARSDGNATAAGLMATQADARIKEEMDRRKADDLDAYRDEVIKSRNEAIDAKIEVAGMKASGKEEKPFDIGKLIKDDDFKVKDRRGNESVDYSGKRWVEGVVKRAVANGYDPEEARTSAMETRQAAIQANGGDVTKAAEWLNAKYGEKSKPKPQAQSTVQQPGPTQKEPSKQPQQQPAKMPLQNNENDLAEHFNKGGNFAGIPTKEQLDMLLKLQNSGKLNETGKAGVYEAIINARRPK